MFEDAEKTLSQEKSLSVRIIGTAFSVVEQKKRTTTVDEILHHRLDVKKDTGK